MLNAFDTVSKSEAAMLCAFRTCPTAVQTMLAGLIDAQAAHYRNIARPALRLVSNASQQGGRHA